MTKSSYLEMNIMLWNHKTKPCWRGCIVHSTSKTQMCFNTPWCDHLFPFESIFYKIKKLKYKLILLCSKCRIKRAVFDFLNLHLLCAYCGHEGIPSIDGLTCALCDALHFFSHPPQRGHACIRQCICINLWAIQSISIDHTHGITPPVPANHLKPYFNWSTKYSVVSLHPKTLIALLVMPIADWVWPRTQLRPYFSCIGIQMHYLQEGEATLSYQQ